MTVVEPYITILFKLVFENYNLINQEEDKQKIIKTLPDIVKECFNSSDETITNIIADIINVVDQRREVNPLYILHNSLKVEFDAVIEKDESAIDSILVKTRDELIRIQREYKEANPKKEELKEIEVDEDELIEMVGGLLPDEVNKVLQDLLVTYNPNDNVEINKLWDSQGQMILNLTQGEVTDLKIEVNAGTIYLIVFYLTFWDITRLLERFKGNIYSVYKKLFARFTLEKYLPATASKEIAHICLFYSKEYFPIWKKLFPDIDIETIKVFLKLAIDPQYFLLDKDITAIRYYLIRYFFIKSIKRNYG
jgi:hypothetical protein